MYRLFLPCSSKVIDPAVWVSAMKSPPGWTPDEGHMRRVVIPGACPPYYTRWKTGGRGQRTEDRRWKAERRWSV